jgi:hypothetical protein
MGPQRNSADYVVVCRNQLNGYRFYCPLERFSIREVILDLGRGAVDRLEAWLNATPKQIDSNHLCAA